MRNKHTIAIRQLDNKLQKFQSGAAQPIPEKGWIHSIRTTLNMTLEQLGRKLYITKQGAKAIEDSEAKNSITIKSMKEVADAMDMNFVYGFVPKDGSIDALIFNKAKDLARNIVMRTNQNMVMESQSIEDEKLKNAIEDLTEEFKTKIPKILWD